MVLADAFDTEELLSCLEKLLHCLPVQIPVYDFKRHRRCTDTFRKVLLYLHGHTLTSHYMILIYFSGVTFQWKYRALFVLLKSFLSFLGAILVSLINSVFIYLIESTGLNAGNVIC